MNTIQRSDKALRNSNFELLRIIAMLRIISRHFVVHGNFSFSATDLSVTRFWLNFISSGGYAGLGTFVMISGYFLIGKRENGFNLKKLLKLWGQVFFYSIVIFAVFAICGGKSLNIKSIIKAFFPIISSEWWFASTYFVLLLIHPFLNYFLHRLNKKQFQTYLVLVFTCWYIIPTFTTSGFNGSQLTTFICLYSLGAYIRLFGLNPKLSRKHYFICFIVFSVLTYLSSVLICILGTKWELFSTFGHIQYFMIGNKITVLLIAVSLFMVFEKTKIPYNKWINVVASATFGVYLIHDNSYVREFLWIDLFKNAQFQTTLKLIPYSIGVVFAVYSVCTLIELGRINFIEKPYLKLVDKYADKALKPFEKIIDWTKALIFGSEN